jgi:AcrR family transcriptional regulator
MSTGYELVGRIRQKHRTRDALVGAARELVSEGATPTVEMAAERAGVSRTTAYRYFPSQAALLANAHPEIVTTTLLPADAPADVAERLRSSSRTGPVVDTEPQQRTMLRFP